MRLLALWSVMAAAALMLPAHTVLAAPPEAPLITSVACTITVEFDATLAETEYRVDIWDDFVVVFSQTQLSTSAGQTLTFTYTFAAIGDQAAGVAVEVFEDGVSVFDVDPYTAIDETCDPGVVTEEPETTVPGCPVGIPSGSVGGAFVAPGPVYSVPGQLVIDPPITIEAGKTAWVIGLDASGQYYKIFWACQHLWVPANTIGPNYDEVWNGMPLPTRTVET